MSKKSIKDQKNELPTDHHAEIKVQATNNQRTHNNDHNNSTINNNHKNRCSDAAAVILLKNDNRNDSDRSPAQRDTPIKDKTMMVAKKKLNNQHSSSDQQPRHNNTAEIAGTTNHNENGNYLVDNNFMYIDDENDDNEFQSTNNKNHNNHNNNNNNNSCSNNDNLNNGSNQNNTNKLKNQKIKNQISLCITEDEYDDGQQKQLQQHLQKQQKQLQHVIEENQDKKINEKEKLRVHDSLNDNHTNKHDSEGQSNECGKGNSSITDNNNEENGGSTIHQQVNNSNEISNSVCDKCMPSANSATFNENSAGNMILVKYDNSGNRDDSENNSDSNNIGVANMDIAMDNMDPYVELEMYLEKVKNEITEVFEKLQINEKSLADEKSASNIIAASTVKKQIATPPLPIARIPRQPSAAINNNNNNCKISNDSNNNSNDRNNTEDSDKKRLLSMSEYKSLPQFNNSNSGNSNNSFNQIGYKNKKNNSNQNNNNNSCNNEWEAIDIMDELNNLVQSGLQNLSKVNTISSKKFNKNNNNNNSGELITKTTTTTTTNTHNNNNNSQENLNDQSRHHQFTTECKSLPDSRKPPLCKNSKIIRNLDISDKTANNYILKISEELNEPNEPGSAIRRESSTQTSPFLNNLKKNAEWHSDDSIVRSTGTTDEDNKSTSSSACCEDVSPVLSSGKSGNSLDSTGLETIENGGASPQNNMKSWNHTFGSSPHHDKSQWIRQENSTPQTHPSIIRSLKMSRSQSNTSEPDLLDVLSLCEENTVIDDDFNSYHYNRNDYSKSGDSLFGTDSSSNSIRFNDDDYDSVMLRDKNASPSLSIGNSSLKSYLHKPRPLYIHGDRVNTNSLPVTKYKHHTSADSKSDRIQMMARPRPFCLPIDQEPFQGHHKTNMVELPSPSSASLHSGHGTLLLQELGIKSNSAPLLMKKDKKRDDFVEQKMNLRYSRSQSDRLLAKIEAVEACKWLRAAGFPQYAQMYEDHQFPIDLSNVAKDHSFLEHDPLQSLYRRLVALNQCAAMRLDGTHKHGNNDDSEDDSYALSENWTFQPQSRRWSRVGDQFNGIQQLGINLKIPKTRITNDKNLNINDSRESSPERQESGTMDSLDLPTNQQYDVGGREDQDSDQIRFRRTGSERLKDGAKALLRRVESIKSRRKKRQNREGVVISGPQLLDLPEMSQRVSDLKCFDIQALSNPTSPISPSPLSLNSPSASRSPIRNTPNELKITTTRDGHLSPNRLSTKHGMLLQKSQETKRSHTINQSQSNRTSPLHFFAPNTNLNLLKESKSGDDSSSYCSDGSQDSGTLFMPTLTSHHFHHSKKPSRARRFLQRGSKIEDTGALSDSECHAGSRKKKYFKDANSNITEVKPITITRGGSLNLGKESKRYRDTVQNRNGRSRSLIRRKDKQQIDDSDHEDDVITMRTKSCVVRWHSFQSSDRQDLTCRRMSMARLIPERTDDLPIAALSCGQLQVIRKLALVTLTGYMERYCPTHRSGWNWELPKFIKKIKSSGYKDKKVFGVPLLLISQRTGQTLPKSIYAAIKWLKLNALDQVGIFRKSGAQPRIQKLKSVVETFDSDSMGIFDGQQGYDVADMVKQYYRELPECLMTNKMSETFIAIFHHLPQEIRMEAVYAAILLLPDEHREALNVLLEFLHLVAENSEENRMTASNLGMCFGPTLLNTISGSGLASPKRRKGAGVPDARELSETLASQNCITFLIQNYQKIFTISKDRMERCNFGYMEESKPVTLEQLGEGMDVQNWQGYLSECISATIKEGREKSRGWFSITSYDPSVEIAYKKVGDKHPLRLWRCITEVEAPPQEVLHLILKERHIWDTKLMKWRIVDQLDKRTEVVQYVCGDQTITDYCVLRSWKTESLPRGACVIVETSIEHPDAKVMHNGIRGVVLASRYLIEPCGSGKSRIMHLARVDMKGRSPEWYNKCYGNLSSQYLSKIRNSFKHVAEGPESKV